MDQVDACRNAARLLYKGLNPKAHPQHDREYLDLVRTWIAEPDFRELVDGAAEGFELVVLDVSERGIVIAPKGPNSRFAMGVSEYRRSLERDGTDIQRGTIVVLQVGIAAAFFPTAGKLENLDDSSETLRLADIRDVVLNLCRRLAEHEQGDAQALPSILRRAWDMLLSLPVHQPDAQRASLSSLDGAVQLVLNQLRDQGLVRFQEGADGGFYYPSRRYRLLLARRASGTLFALCHRLAAAEGETP